MTPRRWWGLPVVLALGACLVLTPVSASAGPHAPADMRWCLGDDFGPPRPIDDLRHQQKAVRRALRSHDPDYVVERAVTSHFGSIALVDGNVAKAERELHGIDRVASWTKHFLDDVPPGMRIGVYKQSLLMPLMERIRSTIEPLEGSGDLAFWQKGDGVVVPWKAPIPTQVQALAGVQPNGAEVRVVTVPYSTEELLADQERLLDYLDAHHVRWSSASHCDSNAGLELDVPGEASRLGVTQAELDQVAGVPVLVIGGVHVASS